MNYSKIIIWLTLSFCTLQIAANEFTPIVNQYNKKVYAADNQNWAVAQDSRGIMYFGNNAGLLQFDGSNFSLYKLPGKQIVRSLYIDKNDRIYVGSFREFGYFEKNQFGQFNYTSLSNLLEKHMLQNDEIWKIMEFQGKILFQSFKSIFMFDGENIDGKSFDEAFLYFQPFNNQLYVHVIQNGFSRFDLMNKSFSKVPDVPFKSAVISVVPFNAYNAYVVTQSDGVFIFNGKNFRKFIDGNLDYLGNANINKAVLTHDSLLVIGTILNGAVAFDKNAKKIWTINTTNNLQNNTVLDMLTDKENNLWLALDKGVSMVRLNKPIRFIQSFIPSIGSVYSLNLLPHNRLYLATNQGLYSGVFSPVSNSLANLQVDSQIKGQVWTLNKIDNQLFCGNNEETYQIYPERKVVALAKGGMCMEKGIIHGREVIVQGTYSDLCVYFKENGEWKFHNTIKGFLNPIRTIAIDYQGRIWASHLHQGLFMIKLKPDFSTIDKIMEIKSLDNKSPTIIYTYTINNRVVFSDNNQFYVYDDIKNSIVPFEELNKSLGKFSRAYSICYQKPSMYWFIMNDEAALVELQDNNVKIIDRVQYSLFQNQTVDNFQKIIPVSDNQALFTLENGLALYEINGKENSNANIKRDILLMEVKVTDKKSEEKMFLPVNSSNDNTISFPYTKNRIKFNVAFPLYYHLNDIMFSYKLTGLNNNWSEKTTNNIKEYSYLRPGKYTFSVQALTNRNEVLATKDYSFQVSAPFYWNTFSKILYFVLLMITAYTVYFYVKRNFEIKKQKIQEEQKSIRKKEIEKREQEIVALKAEKLETELNLKSKELAMSTMNIIRKNEVLTKVKDELTELKKHLGKQYPNKYYDKMIRLLDQNISSDDDWDIFQKNFDLIHENFFRNLHIKYPELTSNDMRYCAFFRLNLSTKDIAHLMNVSGKGVEVARYRIRKKINIPSEKNISEFMIEFK